MGGTRSDVTQGLWKIMGSSMVINIKIQNKIKIKIKIKVFTTGDTEGHRGSLEGWALGLPL